MRLIHELHRLQEKHGYLRPGDMRDLAARLRVPLYRLQGLASFYPHFRASPPPAAEITVCRDISCHLSGARDLAAGLEAELAAERSAGTVAVTRASCLGRCDRAPAACLNGRPLPAAGGDPIPEQVRRIARWARQPSALPPEPPPPDRRWRIDPYGTPEDRYGVLRDLGARDGGRDRFGDQVATEILSVLEQAGLKGMGGAGFPTAVKWRLVRARPETPRTVVVNADESEPGTFKDREILARLPHLVVEGAALAARVVGAGRIIVYIRHEYEPERQALAAEIGRAEAAGVLPCPCEIFVSPGGYILGEETALLEALEDRRGEPRNKPPFPVTHGLHGRPTVINNVETLALAPIILSRGAAWWRRQGRGEAAGLKLIAVSGHVQRPGVYEIPLGLPLGDLLREAGGVPGGGEPVAIAPGGASSPFLPPSALDTPMEFAAMQEAGSMLGSGAVVVMGPGTDLLDAAANVVAFFRNESCGKCVPCRTGTEKAVRLIADMGAGRGGPEALALLPALGETLRLTSICGLGQVALNPILSVLERFPEALTRNGGGAGT